jgi:diaminopimelate decarboxylase
MDHFQYRDGQLHRRVIAGNAGILVGRVLYTKQSEEKRFLIQGAAMNELIRPAPDESFHRIRPVNVPSGLPALPTTTRPRSPGPGHGTSSVRSAARAATSSAGAYDMVMASNDNTRPGASPGNS